MTKWVLFLALVLAAISTPAFAQTTREAAFEQRARELPAILAERADARAYFTEAFSADVPPARFAAIAGSLREQNGPVLKVETIAQEQPGVGTVRVGYARAIVTVRLVVEPEAPWRVTGLMITGSETRNDTMDKVLADLKALPGRTAFSVAELGAGPPRWIVRHNADAQMAVGSAYKLYILGELSRQIAAGEHRWDEVARLGPASLPSGITQKWPKGAPLTLHSLATLMISVSDNTATDTLLEIAGRAKVADFLRATGHSSPEKTLPILRTNETFSLKMPDHGALRDRWARGSIADRTALLAEAAPELAIGTVDFAKLGSMPLYIDTIEWFASATDITALFDALRTTAGPEALAIMGVNTGTDALTAARFDYLGFKGGSEAGVLSLNYLVRDRRGRWFAISGTWNNPERDIDTPRFNGLMVRSLAVVGR